MPDSGQPYLALRPQELFHHFTGWEDGRCVLCRRTAKVTPSLDVSVAGEVMALDICLLCLWQILVCWELKKLGIPAPAFHNPGASRGAAARARVVEALLIGRAEASDPHEQNGALDAAGQHAAAC